MWAPLLNGPSLPFTSVWASAGVAVVVQLWLIIVGAAAALVVAAIAAWAASYPTWQAPEQKEEHRGEEPLEPANHFLALPDDVLALVLSQPLFRATDIHGTMPSTQKAQLSTTCSYQHSDPPLQMIR